MNAGHAMRPTATQAGSMVIAAPIWRQQPTDAEIAFLRRTDRSNKNVHRWLCAPEGLDVDFYNREFPDWEVHRYPQRAFVSVASYSLWLTAPDFYRTVDQFEFVTICQLDAVLIRDVTEVRMSDLDYLGAPWDPPLRVLTPGNRIYVASQHEQPQGLRLTKWLGRKLPVGNGGLSIRRVHAHITATEWITGTIPERYRQHTLEDVLLCAFGPRTGLRVAPKHIAEHVFVETGAVGLESVPDVYGFHGLWRWNPGLAQLLTENDA